MIQMPPIMTFIYFYSSSHSNPAAAWQKNVSHTSPGSSRVCGSAVRKKVAAVKPSLLAVSFAFRAKRPTAAVEPDFKKTQKLKPSRKTSYKDA